MGHSAGQTFLCAGRKSFIGPSPVILTPSRGKVELEDEDVIQSITLRVFVLSRV